MIEEKMKKLSYIALIAAIFLLSFGYWIAIADDKTDASVASGKVIDGYRIISVQNLTAEIHLKVYRGDYIKFRFPESVGRLFLSIPAISVHQEIPGNPDKAPYFKMKKTGTLDFSLGEILGDITVVEYRQANYQAVYAKEAMALIKNIDPFILDVRTPPEFKQGHLPNAVLIPVQELQKRIKEIADKKNQDILIYCATGNRSTMASKILIDQGFKRIYNLRYGIYDWTKKKYPITK